jgi:hypothetical protein
VRFSETTLRKLDATIHLSNGLSAGLGFDAGFVVGVLERITVYESFRMNFGDAEAALSAEATFFLLFGIGFLL